MAADPINANNNHGAVVCVVEPDAGEARRIEGILTAIGAAARLYGDGQSLLADPPPDAACVISEMSLPDMTGAELIAALRTRENHAPVILLAAESDVSSAVAAIRAGALDYLDKAQMDRLLRLHLQRLIHDNGPGAGRDED
jgi:two-component system response regulator FixJ